MAEGQGPPEMVPEDVHSEVGQNGSHFPQALANPEVGATCPAEFKGCKGSGCFTVG